MNALSRLRDLTRADFLRSVGLYFLSDRVVMVRLRKSFLSLSMLEFEERELPEGDHRQAISELSGWVAEEVKEIALKAEHDARDRALRQAIVSLLPHFNPARDSVYVCVPQEQTITQPVFLPLAAEDNLQQVLEYEIERQLPFKRDEIYYDFLPVGKKGEKFCVYVFATPKKALDGLLTLLESFGIKPSGVETTVSALANYLLFANGAGAKSAALVTSHRSSWELLAVDAETNGWKSAPRLLFSRQFPPYGWAQESGKELLQECLSQVAKLYRSGDLKELNGATDHRLAQAEDLLARGAPRLKVARSIDDAEALPAIGVALRGVREASLAANFLRPEGGVKGEARTFSVLNTVLCGLLALSLIAWGVSFPVKDELRLRQLQRENQKLEPSVDALRKEENQLQQLGKEASYLTDIGERRGEVLRILDELSKVVPSNAYLSNLRYRAGVLEVQGNAENASALIPLLERSNLFENVGFNAPSNRGRDNRETFSLKAELEKSREPVKEAAKIPAKDATKEPRRNSPAGPTKEPAKDTKSKS